MSTLLDKARANQSTAGGYWANYLYVNTISANSPKPGSSIFLEENKYVSIVESDTTMGRKSVT